MSAGHAWLLLVLAGCTCGARETTPVAPEEAPAPETEALETIVESSGAGEELRRARGAEADEPTRALAGECDRGITVSCVALAAAWEAGRGVRASEAEARRLFRSTCRRAGEGCLDAARVHPDQAGPYFARGCEAGLAEACRRWAQTRPEEAEQARAKGCMVGWLEACEAPVAECGGPLSRCLERAHALREGQPAQARRLAALGCRDETVAGCGLYADLVRGEDPLAAQVAYEWACTAGDARACRELLDGSFEVDALTRTRATLRVSAAERLGEVTD